MAAQSALWVRSFTRDSGYDKDSIADMSILKILSGDFFGWFVQQEANLDIDTLNKLVSVFWDGSRNTPQPYTLQTFCVADGAFIKSPISFTEWFNPHIRFLTVVQPLAAPWNQTQLFIVGSNEVNSSDRFLQVASWDTKAFNFYAREQINGTKSTAWVYQGNSANAFSASEYLGPFNGHVNGACIMKELHNPWYHWHSGQDSNISQCFSPNDITTFKSTPWLTEPNQPLFKGGSVGLANDLEPIVKSTVTEWYQNRLSGDLAEATGNNRTAPKTQPSNIPRWMAHFLLTTTINIATSPNDGQTYTAPVDHFINSEMLSEYGKLLPFMGAFDFRFDIDIYKKARATLGLSLLQEVDPDDVDKLPPEIPKLTLKPGTLGGGKQTAEHSWVTFLETAANTEGIPFVVLQSSYEDAQGVMSIQQINLGNGFPEALLSDKAFQALTMIDYCNPIYSWRRGVLCQYVPSSISLQGQDYDLEATFVAAIRNSPFAKDPDSPEYQFLAFYDSNKTATDCQETITQYLQAVSNQLNTDEGMLQYLLLAESRRRIYRPLPLDEFGFTLPYATKIPVDAPFLEMTENGTTQVLPDRGLKFLSSWTGTLWTSDPQLLPQLRGLTQPGNGIQNEYQGPLTMKAPRSSGCPVMKPRRLGARQPKISNIVSNPT